MQVNLVYLKKRKKSQFVWSLDFFFKYLENRSGTNWVSIHLFLQKLLIF